MDQILKEEWNSTQRTDAMTFDYAVRWQIIKVIVQLSQTLQSLNVVEIHIRMKNSHSYMSRDAIT